MKRIVTTILVLSLAAAGCKKVNKAAAPGTAKSGTYSSATNGAASAEKGKENQAAVDQEKAVAGKWSSPEAPDFFAVFKSNRTGETITVAPEHRGKPTGDPIVIPFTWTVEGNRIKITEGKSHHYYAEVKGDKLEVEVGGKKSVMQRAK